MTLGLTNRVLRYVVFVGLAGAVGLLILIVTVPPPPDPDLKLRYMQFYSDAFKTLLVSFVASVIVVIIPQNLNEAKYTFERLRDSRHAYSEAHTGITYVEYHLVGLDYAAAITLLESIHVKKHMAETYDELRLHLGRKGEDVEHWSGRIARKLERLTTEIGSDMERWTKSTPSERLARLVTLSKVEECPPA